MKKKILAMVMAVVMVITAMQTVMISVGAINYCDCGSSNQVCANCNYCAECDWWNFGVGRCADCKMGTDCCICVVEYCSQCSDEDCWFDCDDDNCPRCGYINCWLGCCFQCGNFDCNRLDCGCQLCGDGDCWYDCWKCPTCEDENCHRFCDTDWSGCHICGDGNFNCLCIVCRDCGVAGYQMCDCCLWCGDIRGCFYECECPLCGKIDTCNPWYCDTECEYGDCGICEDCEENFKKGHVTGGDKITITDALEVLKHLAGITTLTGNAFEAALITPQSKASRRVSIGDVLEILKHLAGISKIN